MNAGLARRQAALAGVALVGALGAIALAGGLGGGDGDGEEPPPAASVRWEDARVSVFTVAEDEPAGCDLTLGPGALGVAHPVLPCGARLVLDYGGRLVETRVIARGPVEDGSAFAVSSALAAELGLVGAADLRWRFAD